MLPRSVSFLFVAGLAPFVQAQTAFPEVEPNETKATATATGCMVAGDSITGTSTGTSTTVAGPASADTFLVTTCAAPLGIYEHRLTVASANGASIRGLGQTGTIGIGGTPNAVENEVQANQTTPTRFNVWYGFGKQEQLYYRVTGAAATTAAYTSTLSTTPITATPIVAAFLPGNITITTASQGHSTDTDIWLYDANLDAIPTFGNDDTITPFSRQSTLTRNYPAGVYYLALTSYNLANNQGAANDDQYVTGVVTDFPNIVLKGFSSTANTNVAFSISDGTTTLPVAATMNTASNENQVLWFTFTVGNPAVFHAICTNGSLGTDHASTCPCGNVGAPGNGCGHSFDANGANLTATGTAAADDVQLHSQFEPATSFTLFLQHALAGDTVFHDGVLCAGGTLIRLRGRAAVGGEAFFPNLSFPQDQTITLSQRGGVTVGSGAQRYYSAWFRNASTTFCPPATANISNGWTIVW